MSLVWPGFTSESEYTVEKINSIYANFQVWEIDKSDKVMFMGSAARGLGGGAAAPRF